MYRVDNAVIMAAGTSSRFAPLSFEKHKALIEVRGEVLIERQIRQLREAGIKDIYIITGYKADDFIYLKDKYGVELVYNCEYNRRNNNSSIYAARNIINNSYICSADDYFQINPFNVYEDEAYYATVYSHGSTEEWCVKTDDKEYITGVTIGGSDSWYMLGHTFWDQQFTRIFLDILCSEYNHPNMYDKLWESVYIEHIDKLFMKSRHYPSDIIYELDSLEDLREFDQSYVTDTRSAVIKSIAEELEVTEDIIKVIKSSKGNNNEAEGFIFKARERIYRYIFLTKEIIMEEKDGTRGKQI